MATKDLILAIDQGTTGTTALVLDDSLSIVRKHNVEFSQIYPQPGWVEHDLDEIWRSVLKAIACAVEDLSPTRFAAIGITNQRETVGLWESKTGRPIANAIVWQCRRTSEICTELKAKGLEPRLRTKTGLLLDPYFSGTKLCWYFQQDEGLRVRAEQGEIRAGTIDTFLVDRLTGGQVHVTDPSNASRTLLFDIERGVFDEELLDIFSVPRTCLPEVRSSAEVYGHTRGVAGLPDGIPIAGIAGDQQAALFGQACLRPGDVKCTYGTGAFILMNTGRERARSNHGLLTTVAWQLEGSGLEYALEGSVFCAGAAVQWLRDGLGIIENAADIERLAREVEDSGEVAFVPALTGLGAPHWRPEARGLLAGITRDTTRGHIARATLEGIALQCAELIQAMEKDTGALRSIRVDGGASANNLLMQIQADLLQCRVVRPQVIETTAAGAAMLAGIGSGLFASPEEVQGVWQKERVFEPAEDPTRDVLFQRYKDACARA